MRWVTIMEKDEYRDDPSVPVVFATGIELVRCETSVLVWVPQFTKPGMRERTQTYLAMAGLQPVVEATLNLVRDATPEEIVAAGGKP